jgi:F0F1-type ATP synthase gamma subunit
LINGKTFRFNQESPVSRGAEIKEYRSGATSFSMDEEEIYNTIFDTPIINENEVENIMPIKVSVLNADLKYSNFAVMVGHFENDGMYSGEKALNKYLNNRLSERHRLGFYPGKIGESEVT